MQSRRVNLHPGQRVRHWREIRGLKQDELAERVKMDNARLCRIELGKAKARAEEIEDLAAALDLTMAEFYGASDDQIAAAAAAVKPAKKKAS